MSPAARTPAGYRVYDAAALQRVGFIQRAKALGLSLREIQQLTREPSEVAIEQARLRHALVHKLAATQRRLAELQLLRTELEEQLNRLGAVPTCGHVGECGCWLPTREEVKQMATNATTEDGCTCCGCTCPSDDACTCCGCPDPTC